MLIRLYSSELWLIRMPRFRRIKPLSPALLLIWAVWTALWLTAVPVLILILRFSAMLFSERTCI